MIEFVMQTTNTEWSMREDQVAKEAFDKALEREAITLIESVQERAREVQDLGDLWKLHDFLSVKRHDIDGKYDYRYSFLIFVFARLIKEGWLRLEELQGLDADKLAKISALTKMS
jgi:hypothetical protein